MRDRNECKNLCILARYLFPIPATSATSERIFSLASYACSDGRASTSSENVENVVFIKGIQKLRIQFKDDFNDLF